MISGLQGEFGDLDNKYLKQNIPKYLKISVGNIRKVQENTAALYTKRKTLQVSVIRRSGYVYPQKLKRPPLPSGCEISGCKMSAHAMLSGATPSGFPKRTRDALPYLDSLKREAHDTRDHHTRTIAYPIRICCPNHPYSLHFRFAYGKGLQSFGSSCF